MKKSTIIAVFIAIQSMFFSDVSYGNILKNDHYEDFTLDSTAKNEINQVVNVENKDQPIYFVVVTRPSNKLNLQLNYQTEWRALKEVLQNICGDNIDVNKFAKFASYQNMLSYVTNNKHELEKSCKIVVFNEHFFTENH